MSQFTQQMSGKTVLITGANAGIGKATALGIAKLGTTVVMVSRDRQRGVAARAEIIQHSGNDQIELLVADLASLDAVRRLAHEFQARHDTLHVLINNAGVFKAERTLTPDGIETMFAVNHLAPFLLTNLLLDTLKHSTPARIITVSSGAQSFGNMYFDDLNANRSFGAQRRYAQSKLANVLFTYELARRLAGSGVTANVFEPGFVNTNMPQQIRGALSLFVRLAQPWMSTPDQAAQTAIYLASSPNVQDVSGKFWSSKQKPVSSSKLSYDPAVAHRLWQISEQMVGLDRVPESSATRLAV